MNKFLHFLDIVQKIQFYMDCLEGKLFHFRDNVTGLEADSILEFSNGEYAIVQMCHWRQTLLAFVYS